MNKTWNVNGLGDNLRKLISYYKSNPASEEEIKDAIKKVFTEAGVDDSRFKLFKVSVRGDLAEIEGKDASSYANGLASRIYKVKNREKVINGEKSENGSENMNEKEKAPKKTVSIDVAKLIRKPSAVAQKSALIEVLVDRGIDIYVPVSEATIKNLDIPIDLRQIEGRPLIDGLVDIIKAMSKEYFKNNSQAPAEEQKQESTKELAPEDRNIDGPSDEELKNLGESSNTLQFFVGYKNGAERKVKELFKGNPGLFDKFKDFVEKYNYLMTIYTSNKLDKDTAIQIHDDILPQFNDVVTDCSKNPEVGSQIINLCNGMCNILKEICVAEINGQSLSADEAQQKIRKMGITTNELDGIANDNIDLTDDSLDNYFETFGEVPKDFKYEEPSFLLPENIRDKIKDWAVDDIFTMADWLEFTKTEEYQLLQNTPTNSLGKSDTPPM